jgi:cytochrome b subunit of formate dehydrogenase
VFVGVTRVSGVVLSSDDSFPNKNAGVPIINTNPVIIKHTITTVAVMIIVFCDIALFNKVSISRFYSGNVKLS